VLFAGEFIPSSIPFHVINGTGSGVYGVTSFGEWLFVIRYLLTQIDVYNVSTFTVDRQLQVGVAADAWSSLAADSINNCVYMSKPGTNQVYRVGLTGSNTSSKLVGRKPSYWTVGERCR